MALSAEHLFHILSDETRLRCIMLLRQGELCVCELTEILELSQPKISRHLALMRESGLIKDRREGRWVHYQIHPRLPEWAQDILDASARSALRQQPYNDDRKRLTNLIKHNSCGLQTAP